jgi:hypothetical protein
MKRIADAALCVAAFAAVLACLTIIEIAGCRDKQRRRLRTWNWPYE